MTSGSGPFEPERFERDDDGGEDGSDDSSSVKWQLRDPVLVALAGVRTVLRGVDALYRRFERLPGRIRFGVGVSTFVASAHVGDDVRFVVDIFTHAVLTRAVRSVLGLSTGIQMVLLLMAVVSVQMTVVNKRTKAIQSELESREMAADDSPLPDGGRVYRRLPAVESGRTGALGGIVPGMVLGSLFGWGGVFGGAILGAIVGDEIERWYDRRRTKRKIASFVLQSLLREGVQSSEAVPTERIQSWFPSRDADLVDEVVADLASGEDTPLAQVGDGRVRLTDVDEAETYLREELNMITLPQ